LPLTNANNLRSFFVISAHNVRKVGSRFDYILLIFALTLGMTLKVVGIDAKLNSLSNGDIFNGGHRAKNRVFTLKEDVGAGWEPRTLTLVAVFLVKY
jgi:hypothetical protein